MENAKIMVIDDEESMCKFMQIMLKKEGYDVFSTQSSKEALDKVKSSRFDLVIADLMMPEMNGIELLSKVKSIDPDLSFIVMTAYASVDTAIEALKKGAFDYIAKPFKVEELKITIKKSLEQKRITKENLDLKKQLKKEFSLDSFIGNSSEILEMKKLAEKVSQTDSTVLIQGESGTGKELVAKAIHYHSRRSSNPFVTINCAALPESLLESELFGHVKGSFTGAIKDKEGLFKVADGGTFFLDEIGVITKAIQVKLLRVLEEKEITPVGSTRPIQVDVRLVAATNADLEQEVRIGNFRADLFYRLNVFPIHIPPLRKRTDDIKLLASYFVKKYGERFKLKEKKITEEASKRLLDYPWPGNVRELENVVERAMLLTKDESISISELPEKVLNPQKSELVDAEDRPQTPDLETIEKTYIFWVLNQTNWQKAKAAQILGIDSSTLYRKIEKYGLKEK